MKGLGILVVLALVLNGSAGLAYDHVLSDCARSSVQAAINGASDSDTVTCPRGSWAWDTSPLTISGKAITLRGAGDNNTVITLNTGSYVNVTTTSGKFTRITGFKFVKGTTSGGSLGELVRLTGSATSFRLDHLVLADFSRGVTVTQAHGLIDHCLFIGPSSGTPQGVSIFGNRATGGGDTLVGSSEWQSPVHFGTGQAVYVEDSTFVWSTTGDSWYDAYGGARFVLRYNTVYNIGGGHHGNDSGGYRSPHSYEIYNNTIYKRNGGTNMPWVFNNRGGTGVYYNNTATGNINSPALALRTYRAGDGIYSTPPGACNGTNSRDGNLNGGWPCQDQIGRTTDTSGDGLQDSLPLHQWNNTLNGAPWTVGEGSTGTIKAGRDYYNRAPQAGDAMYGYKAFTYPHPLQSGILPPPSVGKVPMPPGQPKIN